MKLVVMIAAWAVSAVLVLPTVSQGQSDSIHREAAAAFSSDRVSEREA